MLRPPGFIARRARPRPAHPAHAFWPAASLLAACLSAASLTAACGTGAAGPRPGAHRLEKTHLNVLAQQVVDDAPFWIALRDGFFGAAGLSVTVKPLAKTPLGIQALKTGLADVLVGGNFPTMLEDDASGMLEPFLTQAELSDGAFPVVDQLTGPTEALPISGTFTTDAFVRRYPGTAAAFQRAMLRAQDLADVNRDVVEKVLPTYVRTVTPNVAALVHLGTYPTGLDPVPLQRVADLLFASHLLARPLNVAPLLFR